MKYKLLRLSLLSVLCVLFGGNLFADDSWVLTDATDLETGDVVVIVDQTTEKAMPNNGGTANAPTATAVTLINEKSEISGEVAENLQWVVTVGTDDASATIYQFGVAGTDNYLYCTASNNGVRVGTNANNKFKWIADATNTNSTKPFLVNVATTRYLGVYYENSVPKDWRCYTSINANIKATATAFYKKISSGTTDNRTATTVTFAEGYATSGAVGDVLDLPVVTISAGGTPIDAVPTWESDNEGVANIANGKLNLMTKGTAKITASFAGDNDLKPSSKSYTVIVCDKYTTIAAILENITSTKTDMVFEFTDLLVTYVKNNYTYVSDGTDAIQFYGSESGLKAGDKITGSISGKVYTYNNLPEITDYKLTVTAKTEGNEVTFTPIAPDALANNINKPIIIDNAVYVSVDNNNYNFIVGETSFVVRNTWGIDLSALTVDKAYKLTGMGSVFKTTNQLNLISFEDATAEPAGFRDIKLDLTAHPEVLTEAPVYITVAEDGTIGTTEDADKAAATIQGKVHNSYGSSNFTASVPVQGCVKITYATHDYGNDIVVTNSEGTEVAKFNTQGAKWMSNHDNVVVAYYRTNTPTTLNFSNANYNPYFAVEAIAESDLPPVVETATVTFALGNQAAEGVVPEPITVNKGEQIHFPTNYTLYVEGKTLKYWMDAEGNALCDGVLDDDITVYPYFEDNTANLADRTEPVTISFNLSGYNDYPKYKFEGNNGIMVTQATVNEKTIDVKVDVDATSGKFTHNGSGWHQVNQGTKVTVPSCKGATIKVNTYQDANALKFGETAATAGADPATYTATAEDATLVIEQTGNGYWDNLEVTLPVVAAEPAGFRDIKLDLTAHPEVLTEAPVYITVAEDGTIGTTEDADKAAATIQGKVHNSYGSSNFTASVPVQGCVKITYATHDYGNDIVVTNSEGTEVAKFNTQGAKWMSNHDNVVVAYYRTNAPTMLNFSKANYNPYFAVEAIAESDLPAEVTNYNITFAAGVGVEGTAPAALEVKAGDKFTAPKNYTLYKEGSTLIGWESGDAIYLPGQEVTPEGDMTLTAKFAENEVSLADRTAAVTLSYNLSGYNDNPKYKFEGNKGFIVTQATVNSKSIDVKVDVDAISGKFAHNGSGWHQVNQGTKVTVPSCKGATISVTTYTTASSIKINGVAGEQNQQTFTYTATTDDATAVIEQVNNDYWNNLAITLPVVATDPDDPTVSNDLIWDYTEAAPSANPDKGLYYNEKVNDAAGTNNGMKGIKLNNGGWAYFEKATVAGKLTLTFGNRKTTAAYAVNVYTGAKGADGKPVKGELIGEIAIESSPGSGSIDLSADVTGVWIERKTSAEGVLQKIVFKETKPRTFKDFEIPYATLTANGYTGADLPEGVTFSGTFHDNQHGYQNATLVVPVDGTVKFTISGCQYANPATFTVKNTAGETLATLNQKDAGCFDNNGNGIITYIYAGDATTLTFSTISYLSYFKAEATEVSEAVITYKDQNDKTLGTKTVYEGDPVGEVPYTEADLTIPDGEKFRGWVYNTGVKVKATDIISGNVTIKASVTAIETAPETGSIQTYDLTKATFYPEDHENFNVTNGAYYNDHGFTFDAGGSFDVKVGAKAQIVLTLCQFGNGTTITVTDAAGKVIRDDVPAKSEADGGTTTVNYEGEATTLTFTFAAQTYLHKVVVYNVNDFMKKDEGSGFYIVPAGDAASLILALNAASSEEGAKIFLPDGTYDLGETVLTGISGKNVSLIGQSMEKTIIKNAPPISLEGLGKADLLVNTGEGLYIQDLTLQNALDYYAAGTGRAVTLHDKGTKTVNKNVRHLSYQDTYYSHKVGGLYYFEGGEMHGTVDFMCGNGKAYFNEMKIVNEKRSSATMTANSELYVFNNCVVENNADSYNFGRAWSDNPVCIWLNTTLNDPNKLISSRWNLSGINCDYSIAGEYGTKNAEGQDITPEKNVVTFTKANTEMNTILTAEQAAVYTIDYVLGEWAAEAKALAVQVEAPAAELKDGTISWVPANNGAIAYAIFKNDQLLGITQESKFVVEAVAESGVTAPRRAETADKYTIRAANARGGFGVAKEVNTTATGISNVKNGQDADAIYNLQGVRVNNVQKGVYVVNGKKVVIK